MENPNGPFGELRPVNLAKLDENRALKWHCYGWLEKVDGAWALTARGRDLFYLV